jgi:hypothetical protein
MDQNSNSDRDRVAALRRNSMCQSAKIGDAYPNLRPPAPASTLDPVVEAPPPHGANNPGRKRKREKTGDSPDSDRSDRRSLFPSWVAMAARRRLGYNSRAAGPAG